MKVETLLIVGLAVVVVVVLVNQRSAAPTTTIIQKPKDWKAELAGGAGDLATSISDGVFGLFD